jgi:hypothetical protein
VAAAQRPHARARQPGRLPAASGAPLAGGDRVTRATILISRDAWHGTLDFLEGARHVRNPDERLEQRDQLVQVCAAARGGEGGVDQYCAMCQPARQVLRGQCAGLLKRLSEPCCMSYLAIIN